MPSDIKFNKISSQKEFFTVFQGLCDIAELAFNNFDEQFKNPRTVDAVEICRNISYLMSITFVIMGMRGDYSGFRDNNLLSPFFVEIDGVNYHQAYLYQMNDYFADRFNKVLSLLEKIDPESHKLYKAVWGKY